MPKIIIISSLTLVAVVFSFSFSQKTFEEKFDTCFGLSTSRGRMECFEKELAPDLKKQGVDKMLKKLEKVYLENDRASEGGITKCHDAAHSIGMLAGMSGDNIQNSYASCTNLCGFGCHMGVIEGYYHQNPEKLNSYPETCRNSTHPYSCVHAVGHYISHDTGNLEKSLAVCDLIPEIEYRGHCTSGVFMELFEQPIHSDTSYIMPLDLKLFCNKLDGVHKSFCFTMSGFYEYLRTNEVEKGIEMCLESHEPDVCFNNYSKALFYKENGNAKVLYEFCNKMPVNFIYSCQSGVLNASYLSDPVMRHAKEFCGLFEGVQKSSCFDNLSMFENYEN